MTPEKQKALDLYDKYLDVYANVKSLNELKRSAKTAAIIAVDEIIEVLNQADNMEDGFTSIHIISFWIDVKMEIENL